MAPALQAGPTLMTGKEIVEKIRAGLEPHGIFLRGIVEFDRDGPEIAAGRRASTVILLGNIGGSIWPAFNKWRAGRGQKVTNPLDTWSTEVIRPLAESLGGRSYFPSEKPWQPFQQWAMRAEGLKPSPLGVLIHPDYGLWHGYRGAIGFGAKIGILTTPANHHPCDSCLEKPCLTRCPVDAVKPTSFDVPACRSHIHSPVGRGGCMQTGCIARNACPVGADYRYLEAQMQFHMAALG
jgi:ferredoxin